MKSPGLITRRMALAIVVGLVFVGSVPAAEPNAGDASDDKTAAEIPEKYILDYPAAERFCPPVRGAFEEASRTLSTVGRRIFRHPPNGNYGFVQKVRGKTLVHTGADLALFRVGEPVFAVADGVVRLSSGPEPPDRALQRAARRGNRKSPDEVDEQARDQPPTGAGANSWGNLVVIEHRLPGGEFVTTIYGHLDTDRLVKTGDIVRAGQQVGDIGRRHPFINGGYHPHLHFGVKEGRLVETGRGILPLNFGAGPVIARIAAIDEDELELEPGQPLPETAGDFRMSIGGVEHEFRRKGDRYVASSRLLWAIPTTPEFPLVGHTSSTEGFFDPVAFLRARRADTHPAPFLLARQK